MNASAKEKRVVDLNELLKKELTAFCRAGAAVTAEEEACSIFWRNLEQRVANLSDEETALIVGKTRELRSAQPVSPIGEGDTPLHLLIKILDSDGEI